VAVGELAALARERGLLAIEDQGSGCLLDTARFGIGGALREPMVQESLAAGVDLVCFSGDKLLGGPQAGIIAGKAAPVARLKRHPLARALRLDKATIAALAATLLHYRLGEAAREIPVWQMIGAPEAALRRRASAWSRRLRARGVLAAARPAESAIGGGSLPGVTLPTTVAAITPAGRSVDALAAALRAGAVPVVGRIAGETLALDPRTVAPGDEAALLAAVVEAAGRAAGDGDGGGGTALDTPGR
jgi:L-seryl-tRNA(Ser) seleniumtransferase